MATLAPFPTTYAPRGMVCAVDHLAAGAGIAMLRAGGSAADAAVAASAVLAVTTQHMCGMGGDLFALVKRPGEDVAALNSSGRAGSGADPERVRAEGHTAIPLHGHISAVPVPGCVDGWLALHERYGRLPLADVLEPARAYAADGFPASPTLAASFPAVAALPGAADYVAAAPGGRLRPGTLVRRPGVARTLSAIAAGGRDSFYLGEFGEGLVALGDGEFTEDDLRRRQADWVEPLHLEVWDRELWTIPPNSQGYLTLAGAYVASGFELPDPADPQWAHLLVEAARAVGYDRDEVLAEGADGWALLDRKRLDGRRALIEPDSATVLAGTYGEGGTIYLCAVDGDRMGVSLIQSNYHGWGSQLVVPGVNIFLQDRGAGFSLRPGHAAEYGPGRRPPHTLAPLLLTSPDGELAAVLGTMGGDSQPQILLQLLARSLVAGERPGPAIAAGRWVLSSPTTGPTDPTRMDTWAAAGRVEVVIEGQAPEGWDEALRRRGHQVRRTEAFGHGVGHAHAIFVESDHLAGASDPRPQAGAAAGW